MEVNWRDSYRVSLRLRREKVISAVWEMRACKDTSGLRVDACEGVDGLDSRRGCSRNG